MNTDNFYSIDRLVEFGLGMGVAQQMVKSMNHALSNSQIHGTVNSMGQVGLVRPAASYFVVLDGSQAGPFSEEELTRLISAGRLVRDSLVWRAGMPTWKSAHEVPEVLRLVALCPPPPPPIPNQESAK